MTIETKSTEANKANGTGTASRPAHTNVHTHRAGYACSCGSSGSDREVVHSHQGGHERHWHSNLDELQIGPDLRLVTDKAGVTAGLSA